MPKLTVPSIQKLKLKGWPLVIAVGLVLALVAIIDRGGLGDPAAASSGCQLQVTASPLLNVRSAPNGQAALVRTLDSGATVAGTSVVTDGFRRLADGNWVDVRFVTPTAGSTCG